jgi:hypothetical protein
VSSLKDFIAESLEDRAPPIVVHEPLADREPAGQAFGDVQNAAAGGPPADAQIVETVGRLARVAVETRRGTGGAAGAKRRAAKETAVVQFVNGVSSTPPQQRVGCEPGGPKDVAPAIRLDPANARSLRTRLSKSPQTHWCTGRRSCVHW